jgi:preprotein translocase subunit SecG
VESTRHPTTDNGAYAATKAANASILELKRAPVLAKRYVMVVATAFFILALICVYSTMRLIDAAGSVSAQEN